MSPRDRVDRYKGGGQGRRDRDRDRERDQREYYKYRSSRDRNRERSPKERKWDNRRSSGQVNDHRDQLRDQRIERDHRDQREHRERVMDQRDHHHHHHNQQQSSSGSTSTSSVRSVGDWSEHTSSSGKKYYYNCVSEVSQWEKPKEWLDYERQRSQTATSNKIPDGGGGLRGQSQNQSQRLLKMPSNRDRGRNDIDYDDTDSRGSMNNRGSDNRGHRGQDHDLDPRLLRDQREDMEISSSRGTAPTSDESHPRGHGGHSSLHHHHHRDRGGPESHDYYDNSQDKTPPQQADNGTPSPLDGNSTPSRGGHEVTNNLVNNLVSNSPLIALKPQIPSLTPSLARFCKESLIGHVTAWPAEAVERSCQRINEEHLNISNLGITKVSSELKMARSLVRLAEIQATLQEQRILFLRQQSMDLETMRPRVAFLHSIESEQVQTQQSSVNAGYNAQHDQASPVSTPTVVSS